MVLATAVLTSGALACGNEDLAVLEAASLIVTPCEDGEARAFEPFRMEAVFLRWYEMDSMGFLEMRDGYQTATQSDAVYLQVSDTAKLVGLLAESPGASLELDGDFIRMSVMLAHTCPDSTQPIVAGPGRITFTKFDNRLGGRIAGNATFDLLDGRTQDDGAATTLASDATLTFSLEVRRGPPYQEYTN